MLKFIVSELALKDNKRREEALLHLFSSLGINYTSQPFNEGTNYIVDIGESVDKKILIGSHHDSVPKSPGANDNASAMAVSIGAILKLKEDPHTPSTRFVFFDQEEKRLQGSVAYIRQFGVSDISAVLNMELVGEGNIPLFWPYSSGFQKEDYTQILAQSAKKNAKQHYFAGTFDYLTGDHESFMWAGIKNSICLTMLKEEDLRILSEVKKLTERTKPNKRELRRLNRLVRGSATLRTYHTKKDRAENICEDSLLVAQGIVLETIQRYKK
jgi:hypothetical protein